ncbi:ABC transporter permease [Luteolibacter sp. AS25]|uniref:ABC transporter permease n=1 Tax=Luteolibacter sp. AS25 TaxID=3135776 RepID=UPI00398B36F5
MKSTTCSALITSVGEAFEKKEKSGTRRSIFEFRHRIGFRGRLGLGVAAWLVFLGVWQMVSVLGLADPTLFPSPVKVFEAWITLFAEKEFAADVLQSLKRIFVSFGIAVAIALPLGIFMGAFSPVEGFLNALASPFRYLPAPSFVPLLLMWLGTGDSQKIALLVLGVVFFLITLFMDNTKSVPVELVECSRTLGAGKMTVLRRILLPAAMPLYLDTARQMLAVSWTYLVIAEIVAATDGIGAMMMRAKRFVQVDSIMAGILTIGLLGLISDLVIRLIHKKAFKYLNE